MKWVLDVPCWRPPLLNTVIGRGWYALDKAKKATAEMLAGYAALAKIPPATGRRSVAVTLFGWPRGRLPDPDAADKVLFDALKLSGLILDDSAKWCLRLGITYTRSKQNHTRIVIADCLHDEGYSMNGAYI